MTLHFYLIQCWIHLGSINLWPWGLLSLVPSVFIASSPFAVFLRMNQALLFLLISSLSLFLSSAAWNAPVAQVCWQQTLSAFPSVLFPEGLRSSLHFRRIILQSESSPASLPTAGPRRGLVPLKTACPSFCWLLRLSCPLLFSAFLLCLAVVFSGFFSASGLSCFWDLWLSLDFPGQRFFGFVSIPFCPFLYFFCNSIGPVSDLLSFCKPFYDPSVFHLLFSVYPIWVFSMDALSGGRTLPSALPQFFSKPFPRILDFFLHFSILQLFQCSAVLGFFFFFLKPCVVFTVSW